MSTVKAGKKMGLGKGFDALLPQDFDKTFLLGEEERIQKIAVEGLEPNTHQPRRHFDETALGQLADSVKQYGILQPLVVSPLGAGRFEIIAGERRWRAAKSAGLSTVPAIVRTSQELERLEIAIVENVQRVDLSPLEQADSIERLHELFGQAYEDIAKRLGKATSTINNIVRLIQLPDDAKVALRESKISEGHARAILALKKWPEKQAELLSAILTQGWSVRQAERYVVSVRDGFRDTKATKERMRTQTPATRQLSKKIGAPVQIRRTAKGGKLEIVFKSDDQLEQIMQQLG